MSEKLTAIIEQLKSLTLLEASELVTEIEKVFGVDTSVSVASVGMAAPAAAGSAPPRARARGAARAGGGQQRRWPLDHHLLGPRPSGSSTS